PVDYCQNEYSACRVLRIAWDRHSPGYGFSGAVRTPARGTGINEPYQHERDIKTLYSRPGESVELVLFGIPDGRDVLSDRGRSDPRVLGLADGASPLGLFAFSDPDLVQ